MKGVLDKIVNGKMGYSSSLITGLHQTTCVTVIPNQSCLTDRFIKVRQLRRGQMPFWNVLIGAE